MEKVEIIQNTPSETELDTSKGTNVILPFYQTISVLSTIFKWQPMGKRIVINLPLVGDDRGFLFFIRCNPWIPYLPELMSMSNDVLTAVNLLMNHDAVVHDVDWGAFGATRTQLTGDEALALVTFYTDPGVYIVTHSAPPFISKLAEMYRYWKGGLEYRLRTKAGFTHAANLIAMPINGARLPHIAQRNPNTVPLQQLSPFNYRCPIFFKEKFSYLGAMANSFQNSDLSINRHMEVGWSYNHPFPFVDQFANVANTLNTKNDQIVSWKPNAPCYENFIGVGMRGTIDNSSVGSNQIEIEIEVRAAQDFQVSGENMAFSAISDMDLATYGTAYSDSMYGSVVSAGGRAMPRKYYNPWLTVGTEVTASKFNYVGASSVDGYLSPSSEYIYD